MNPQDSRHSSAGPRRSSSSRQKSTPRAGTIQKKRSTRESELSDSELGRELTGGDILVDRYIIQKFLGKGGMGTVYSAWDRDSEMNVAVKVISAESAGDPAMVTALQKELAQAKRLPPHRNLLRVYEAHLRADPPLISLELAKEDLHARWVGRGRHLNVDEIRALIGPVLDGLGVLHDAGHVHRDIKPENILLTEAGEVKISDYGISRSAQEQVQARGSDGSGTPMYMAPEQFAGEVTDLRADLYSLGVMVYELTVGRLPFPEDDAAARDHWHQHGTRDVSEVPAALQAFVSACIHVDPNERPRNALAARSLLMEAPEVIQESPGAVEVDIEPEASPVRHLDIESRRPDSDESKGRAPGGAAEGSKQQLMAMGFAMSALVALVGVGAMTVFFGSTAGSEPGPSGRELQVASRDALQDGQEAGKTEPLGDAEKTVSVDQVDQAGSVSADDPGEIARGVYDEVVRAMNNYEADQYFGHFASSVCLYNGRKSHAKFKKTRRSIFSKMEQEFTSSTQVLRSNDQEVVLWDKGTYGARGYARKPHSKLIRLERIGGDWKITAEVASNKKACAKDILVGVPGVLKAEVHRYTEEAKRIRSTL